MKITFTVFGRPQQRGSKQAVLIPKRGGGWVEKNGRPIVVAKDDNPKSKDWMAQVRSIAAQHVRGDLVTAPVRLSAVFYFARPQSHFGTGKNAALLKASAPSHMAQSPDLDKLVRCIGDSLTGVVYRDDKQVCQFGEMRREWTTSQERAEITIETLA